MAGKKATPSRARKTVSRTAATGKKSGTFTAEERAAMKERAQELKAQRSKADGESALLAKIRQMAEPDRTMAERLHAIIKTHAPMLTPKTWYGMPAYAREGKVVCFFQSTGKFNTRYATLGFADPQATRIPPRHTSLISSAAR